MPRDIGIPFKVNVGSKQQEFSYISGCFHYIQFIPKIQQEFFYRSARIGLFKKSSYARRIPSSSSV